MSILGSNWRELLNAETLSTLLRKKAYARERMFEENHGVTWSVDLSDQEKKIIAKNIDELLASEEVSPFLDYDTSNPFDNNCEITLPLSIIRNNLFVEEAETNNRLKVKVIGCSPSKKLLLAWVLPWNLWLYDLRSPGCKHLIFSNETLFYEGELTISDIRWFDDEKLEFIKHYFVGDVKSRFSVRIGNDPQDPHIDISSTINCEKFNGEKVPIEW